MQNKGKKIVAFTIIVMSAVFVIFSMLLMEEKPLIMIPESFGLKIGKSESGKIWSHSTQNDDRRNNPKIVSNWTQHCKIPDHIIYNITENVTADAVLNSTANQLVQSGGIYIPLHCKPIDTVAIIVPYRNRSQHRDILLNHLHNFLQRQMIEYGIFFVEPAHQLIFNRGILCNIGYKIAMSQNSKFTCIVFHDVDQLPLNSGNHYSCSGDAKHLLTASSKYKYKLPYPSYTGGIISFKADYYSKINGFSNVFFGWGGEDDDILMRGKLYKTSKKRYKKEGLNTLEYKLLGIEQRPLYTWIYVSYNETAIMKEFNEVWNKTKLQNGQT